MEELNQRGLKAVISNQDCPKIEEIIWQPITWNKEKGIGSEIT